MRLKIRVNSWDSHVKFTVFCNGGNCGELTMREEEFQKFNAAFILIGKHKGLDVEPGPMVQPEGQSRHVSSVTRELRNDASTWYRLSVPRQKFWFIRQNVMGIEVWFGAIGSQGVRRTKAFKSAHVAREYRDKKIKEKLRKGYQWVGNNPHDAPF